MGISSSKDTILFPITFSSSFYHGDRELRIKESSCPICSHKFINGIWLHHAKDHVKKCARYNGMKMEVCCKECGDRKVQYCACVKKKERSLLATCKFCDWEQDDFYSSSKHDLEREHLTNCSLGLTPVKGHKQCETCLRWYDPLYKDNHPRKLSTYCDKCYPTTSSSLSPSAPPLDSF